MQNNTLKVLSSIRKTIQTHQLLSQGETVLVGVSGGADSVCLLHALNVLKEELKIKLAAAHFHHGIRGKDADNDAAFVKKLCKSWKIPCYQTKEDVPALAKEMEVSEETAGRIARYRFFRELCEKKGFTKIATAHHRDDQAETVLMRILRGSGIDGLSGIRYLRHDGVIRPLLDVERAEIEGYCKENNLVYCEDATNQEDAYTRNRIRHHLLPMLKEEFNPNIVTALANLAQNMAEDGDFINGYAQRLYRRIQNPAPGHKPTLLDMETLLWVQDSIRNRLLIAAAQEEMGKDYRLERCHLNSIQGLLEKETGASISLPQGLTVAVRYGWLAFEMAEEPEVEQTVYEQPEFGRQYEICQKAVTLTLLEKVKKSKKHRLVLDYDKIAHLPLQLRTRRNGDRIAVYQDGREKKLKDFLIDAKIPAKERDSIPLLCSGSQVLAVIGHRVAEPYKCTKETVRGLVIEDE